MPQERSQERNARGIRLIKSLRFRLALSYAVFCAIMLTGLGVVLRGVLTNVIESTVHRLLDEEWAALKGFIDIDKRGQLVWTHDPADREETAIIERLRLIYMIANSSGEVIESSELYRELGYESPASVGTVLASGQPYYVKRFNGKQPFLVRQASLTEGKSQYFVALGRDFGPSQGVINQFTLIYFSSLPLFVLSAAALGWFLARRAMQPVSDVAALAEQISGRNLRVKMPLRNSDDELDHLISAFNQMVERLEVSFSQIAQFSTDVSHELRTPVTIVRGQLEVALMTAANEEELRAAIESALGDIDRLSQIIRALLHLAKAESGQIALQLQREDLTPLTARVLEELEIAAADKGVTLTSKLARNAWVRCDHLQIERVLYNLIDNAIKYTPMGGNVHVSLSESPGDGIARLEVQDNGVGIPAEHIPHLFDRFYRVPSRGGEEKGLGLGLSFVAWIVKAHNGSIQVDSRDGEGTKFTVSLPLAADSTPIEPTHGNLTSTSGRNSHP
jgi:heavy metal sensor kinase